MELGGPVWHASVATRQQFPVVARLEVEAERQLQGVGDPMLGEWREWTGKAFHIRRRLAEAEERRVGPVVDVRGTPEAVRRAQALGDMLRFAPREVLVEELGTEAIR